MNLIVNYNSSERKTERKKLKDGANLIYWYKTKEMSTMKETVKRKTDVKDRQRERNRTETY